MHAGLAMPMWLEPFAKRLFAVAITGMIPAARAFANAATLASVGFVQGEVLKSSDVPRLMLIARMLKVAWLEITKLIAETCVEVFELAPLNTSRPRSFVSGATPTTMPETFVP